MAQNDGAKNQKPAEPKYDPHFPSDRDDGDYRSPGAHQDFDDRLDKKSGK